MVDLEKVKELTFYMGDKTDDELWTIVREACRTSTPLWRAYEELRTRMYHLRRMQKGYKKLRDEHHGSDEQTEG